MLSWSFYSASSLKQQSVGRHVPALLHIILIPSKPVFALLMLHASIEAANDNFIVWFDPTGAQNHDLPDWSQAR